MIKNIGLVLAGVIGATAVPSIASTASDTVTLTPGQAEFIRQFDVATGRNFSGLAATPGAVAIIKSASIACGNVEFQKQFVFSAGGNQAQADYTTKKFESLFCGNNL
jgi:hypothetical protein